MNEILIVDDERVLRDGLKATLTGEGFAVRTARDGEEAIARISEKRPDLVLLDVMMPKMNGFRCCQEIRKADVRLPIVFLTAKDAEGDQVRGLGLGADDYVSKTASDAILLARVNRALVRAQSVDAETAEEDCLHLGAVTVDWRKCAISVNGRETDVLTKTEADLLRILVVHRGEMIGLDALIAALRGRGFACEDGMLYSHMSNLRRKLGPAARLLVSKRHLGYALSES